MFETTAPSHQPTSSPSGLWVAPSVPADAVSDFTAEPTNNNLFPHSYEPKSSLGSDSDTMAQSKYFFIGILIVVIAIAVIYLRRRSTGTKANVSTNRGNYELVSVRDTDDTR